MTLFSLIKSGKVRIASGRKVVPSSEFAEILSAKEIVAKAHQEAEQLAAENAAECERLRKEAQEQGHQEGLTAFNEHILYFENRVKEMETTFQNQVLPLALKAAKKIVGEQFAVKPDTIVDIVMRTLKPVSQSRQVKIAIHPDDKKYIEEKRGAIKELLESLDTLAIEERASITPGGCIIETESGIINATLENQWRALEAAFESFNKG